MNVEQRQEIERRLIQHLCLAMRQAGWIPVSVNDGGEIVKCTTDDEVLDTVFSVDESTIIFRRGEVGRKRSVFIVLGNDDPDAICEHSYSEDDDFAKVMKEVVDPFAERLEEGGLGAVSPLVSSQGRPYEQLVESERLAVDAAFNQLSAFVRVNFGIRPKMDDCAERLVDAIATYIIQSRKRS